MSNQNVTDLLQSDTSAPLMTEASSVDVTSPSTPKKGRRKTPLAWLHQNLQKLPMQILLLLLTLTDVSFLIYEFADDSMQFEGVTLATGLSFFLELLIQLGFQGRAFFMFGKYFQIAEVLIVSISFFVEYVEYVLNHSIPPTSATMSIRYMRAVRFLRVLIYWKTRTRQVTRSIRQLVSADRRRFQEQGYDLDLTYVFPHVIAMSWPSEKVEAFYRNHIDNVARFLDDMHTESYMVFNLCSERSYDETKFHNRVKRYRLDDHNPAELRVMLEFAKEVQTFIHDNSGKNVAVIHCKGGKGRTGTMTCSYILYAGLLKSADSALKYFGSVRTADHAKNFQGVESPSQERYVKYFERLLRCPEQKEPVRRVRIKKMRMMDVPPIFWNVPKLWYAVVRYPCTERKVIYLSNPSVTFTGQLPDAAAIKAHKEAKRTQSVPPTEQGEGGCQACSTHYKVFLDDFQTPIDPEAFFTQRSSEVAGLLQDKNHPSISSLTPKEVSSFPTVNLEIDTSPVPILEGDMCFKFFCDEDKPNTLHTPLQFWFNPSFETDLLKMTKLQLDGPHKDEKKEKLYAPTFTVEVYMETVE